MSTSVIILLSVAVIVAIVLAVVSRSGPRVTQIDRTVRREKDTNDA
ncbi:MAG: hypothetical protein ACJ8EP_11960 [Sphingomicrobium sp.]